MNNGKCALCDNKLEKNDIWAFEVKAGKTWYDYELCGECSKELRKEFLKLRKQRLTNKQSN